MGRWSACWWLLACLALSASAMEKINPDLTVTSLERSLDLVSHLVKVHTKITLSNEGQTPATAFHYVLDKAEGDKVAYFGATTKKSEKTYLRPVEVKLQDHPGVKAYRIDLKTPIKAGGSESVEVEVVLAKTFEMFPAEITQKEKQLVMYTGNHYVSLPYKCKTQTTKVTLPTSATESYSKLKPTSHSDTTITYGPYSNVAPFSFDEMSVHYENNNPFLTVTRLERTIELSMWGNIAVEEVVDVRHSGAKLKGSFSRYDFQRGSGGGAFSVNGFKTILPASASDVYYRDDIGNISTSSLRVLDDSVELELRPRFPLFGGWKTHYFIGYNVPSYEYLYNKGDDFVLNMRLLDHIHDDMLVEEMVVKIILPEGAEFGKLDVPFNVKREKDSLHYTYLDTAGRPVITVRNVGYLTEKQIQEFQLAFKFSKSTMAREPLMLIAAFFTFFALAIVYVRLDFAITKDEGSEAKLKVAGFCEKISGHHDKRVNCYNQFDDALVRLKSTKDVAAFQAAVKKIVADHKNETTAITDLNNVLKSAAPEAGEKINELQKVDRLFREQQTNQSGLVEKLVNGKLGKQQFIDQEMAVTKKKGECIEKMNSILRSL